MTEDDVYQPRNRHKTRNAKYGKFWCNTCDLSLIGETDKCPVCKSRGNPRKIKYDKRSHCLIIQNSPNL
jgi:rubrerythrin